MKKVHRNINQKQLKQKKQKHRKDDKTYGNQVNYRNKDVSEGQNIVVNIPLNFFENNGKQVTYKDDVFSNKIKENRDLEQYFWTKDIVKKILHACEYVTDCCCFTTPLTPVSR